MDASWPQSLSRRVNFQTLQLKLGTEMIAQTGDSHSGHFFTRPRSHLEHIGTRLPGSTLQLWLPSLGAPLDGAASTFQTEFALAVCASHAYLRSYAPMYDPADLADGRLRVAT